MLLYPKIVMMYLTILIWSLLVVYSVQTNTLCRAQKVDTETTETESSKINLLKSQNESQQFGDEIERVTNSTKNILIICPAETGEDSLPQAIPTDKEITENREDNILLSPVIAKPILTYKFKRETTLNATETTGQKFIKQIKEVGEKTKNFFVDAFNKIKNKIVPPTKPPTTPENKIANLTKNPATTA